MRDPVPNVLSSRHTASPSQEAPGARDVRSVCEQCGTAFLRRKPTQRFCSRVCFYGWWTATVQPRAATAGIHRLVELHGRAPEQVSGDDAGLGGGAMPDPQEADALAWAERGQYWEREVAQAERTAARRRNHPTQAHPLMLSGHGVRLRVDHGALLVHDGFTHYPQARREWRLFPGDWRLPSRIILLDSDGSLSVDVLAWLAEQRIPLVVLNWRGEAVSVTQGIGMVTDAALRQAQVAAQENGLGLRIACGLVRDKIAASQDTLRTLPSLPSRDLALRKLDAALRDLDGTPPDAVAAVRLIEARAALAYFTCWQTLPLRWKGTGRRPIPPDWQRVGLRQSLMSGTNRNATHPIGAALNYAYGCLESQVRVATVTAGLDPTIGYLHVCRPRRAALVYDLMEPLRPQVDRLVLDFVRSHTFAPGDVILTQTGTCRLHPQLARTVAGLTVGEQPVRDVTAGAVAALSRTATA
jgi:CRISPR-associated protein Cas1